MQDGKEVEGAGAPVTVKRLVGPSSDDFKVNFDCHALGRMRSTGEIICLLLSLESQGRAGIIADVIKQLDIDIDEVVGRHGDRACTNCGMSMYLHKSNGGNCF